jgi:hypothetical protein
LNFKGYIKIANKNPNNALLNKENKKFKENLSKLAENAKFFYDLRTMLEEITEKEYV